MLTKVETVSSTSAAETLVAEMRRDGYDIVDVKVVPSFPGECWTEPHLSFLNQRFLVTITYNPTDRSNRAEARKAREKAQEQARWARQSQAEEQARIAQEEKNKEEMRVLGKVYPASAICTFLVSVVCYYFSDVAITEALIFTILLVSGLVGLMVAAIVASIIIASRGESSKTAAERGEIEVSDWLKQIKSANKVKTTDYDSYFGKIGKPIQIKPLPEWVVPCLVGLLISAPLVLGIVYFFHSIGL